MPSVATSMATPDTGPPRWSLSGITATTNGDGVTGSLRQLSLLLPEQPLASAPTSTTTNPLRHPPHPFATIRPHSPPTPGISAAHQGSTIPIPKPARKAGRRCPLVNRKRAHRPVHSSVSGVAYLKGCCLRIVSSRSGPVETMAIGTSHSCSRRLR